MNSKTCKPSKGPGSLKTPQRSAKSETKKKNRKKTSKPSSLKQISSRSTVDCVQYCAVTLANLWPPREGEHILLIYPGGLRFSSLCIVRCIGRPLAVPNCVDIAQASPAGANFCHIAEKGTATRYWVLSGGDSNCESRWGPDWDFWPRKFPCCVVVFLWERPFRGEPPGVFVSSAREDVHLGWKPQYSVPSRECGFTLESNHCNSEAISESYLFIVQRDDPIRYWQFVLRPCHGRFPAGFRDQWAYFTLSTCLELFPKLLNRFAPSKDDLEGVISFLPDSQSLLSLLVIMSRGTTVAWKATQNASIIYCRSLAPKLWCINILFFIVDQLILTVIYSIWWVAAMTNFGTIYQKRQKNALREHW